MNKQTKEILILIFTTFLIIFLIWIPHLFRINNFFNLNFSNGFNTIYRNFDGLEYIVIAKSLYDPKSIAELPQSLAASYYASHFPLYSLFILAFASFLGFLKSMLFVSVLSTVLSVIAFYILLKDFKLTEKPLFLSIIFLILPARWLIVHSVGSSEPTFILFLILALYYFLKFEQQGRWLHILLAGLFGLLTQLTRPPGILLFICLSLYLFWKMLNEKGNFFKKVYKIAVSYYPLLIIPLGLLGVFSWYSLTYKDFFAYFHSGDNIHLAFPPFQVFNKNQFWVGDIWLEDIVYIQFLSLLGGLLLIKQRLLPLAFFVLTYLAASIMVAHRDISRYILPVFPFLLIAFEKVLVSKEFRIVLVILGIALYLYAQNFIIHNVAPIPNLQPFN